MLTAIEGWKAGIAKAVGDIFQVEIEAESIPVTFPPKSELGDIATPVAFSLAKTLRKNPAVIAGELASVKLDGIEKIEVSGGYMNLFADRAWLISRFLEGGFVPEGVGGKVIVEHTNINPNKAAHVGHLRNAVLGDTLVRCLRYLNQKTEVQNYIDDTGVQVADVVVAFRRVLDPAFNLANLRNLRNLFRTFNGSNSFNSTQDRWNMWNTERAKLSYEFSLDNLLKSMDRGLDDPYFRSAGRFDFFCWELYAKVAPWYEQSEENKKARFETLKLMEEGDNETAEIAALVAEEISRCHLRTMNRLGIHYSVLTRESDILKSGFWSACFEKLKAAGAIHEVPSDSEDKNRGCWVMALTESEDFKGMSDADKVIVRSNGTVTYVGKDMAYQLWKFGLLGRDFHYRIFDHGIENYPRIWRTDSEKSDEGAPSFGSGNPVFNVIDVRQSYLQKIVKEGLRQMGYSEEAERSIHFSYEMVALATRLVKEEIEKGAKLDLSEEDLAKPFVEMSGRKGLGFKADALLDRLVDRAASEIKGRDPDLTETEIFARAKTLAVAALRYYMLKFGKNQIVAFDTDQALAFEGETGPYLQYACVRAEQILEKAGDRGVDIPDTGDCETAGRVSAAFDEDGWALISLLARTPVIVDSALKSMDLNIVARHLHDAAQAFHGYYHKYPVLQEEDAARRETRLFTVKLFAEKLRFFMENLLGIPVPERM